jgi:ribonuclease BN (tRNA processing enzyme)
MDIYGPVGIQHRVASFLEAYRDTIELDLAKDPTATPEGWKATGHDLAVKTSKVIFEDANVKVEAFNHKHFELPYNYAYRVTTHDRVLVIGGDGASDDRLIEAARGADVFVMEVCTEADIGKAPWGGETLAEKEHIIWQYHMKPRDLARIAKKAGVKTLVLYHVQNYSDPYDPEAVLKEVRQFYDGEVIQARDGDIF